MRSDFAEAKRLLSKNVKGFGSVCCCLWPGFFFLVGLLGVVSRERGRVEDRMKRKEDETGGDRRVGGWDRM